ncbi:recombination-associated protein RdgC [Solilutibacter tolerans]|uniref:Recombination-associated protein RdgC n=1 Tax=Solilutibacter tolerans TaxID=1604334 RepID=A0A1N6RTW9_9GAMM|nr:recombination-associated protein RdgC [Lysobacter tolerans]SIQ32275.1 recombination associated protein RdgC [Lysobacter tolerans]
MFFRNLTLFRFPASINFDDLETQLADAALKPVGPMELSSRGFISPFGRAGGEDAALMHRIDDAIWLTVGGEDKLLPSSVVNDLLQKKVDEFEAKNARRPGGKMRRQMKDDLVAELLPRAFVRPTRTDALIDLKHGVIVIDTSSRKVAEAVVSQVREALGSFPALPINAEVAPRAVMTGWIAGDELPEGLSLGDECELRDPADSGAVVKVQRMELAGEEIDTHLEAGKQVARLALTLDDHAGFVLGEDLVLRKFKLLDGAVEQLESSERDDIRAEMDARFALMAGEFKRLFTVLESALKLSKAD